MESDNDIHQKIMDQVERSERDVTVAIVFVAIAELAGLIGFLLLMDFGERLHWLLLVMSFLIYGTLTLGLVALGAFVRHLTLRVIKAIELQHDGGSEATS